jgi:glycine/D-amino acid oxidase-like deaminating enzyme
MSSQPRVRKHTPHIAVIGAGAFGGWTALTLRERGARVTLVDAWGPGNVRASSGGETRVIRTTYGTRAIYTELALRALARWQAYDARWQRGFLRKTGVLWMFGKDDGFGRDSVETLTAAGIPIHHLTPATARQRYPQIDFTGVAHAFFEPEAGYLLARRACEHVVERLVASGGLYRQAAAASPIRVDGPRFTRLRLADGSSLTADIFVFACGPWLGRLFADTIGSRITPTRQEVYYFGSPMGDTRFGYPRLPVWVDVGARVFYGIPGAAGSGFKIADDTPGPAFDPSTGQRHATDSGIRSARRFLGRRFPALRRAPLVSAEVCQYEATPDSHFIVDTHPAARNVWIIGGGSGHGYKMGPAIGEMMAAMLLDGVEPNPQFGLNRFTQGGARPELNVKWS